MIIIVDVNRSSIHKTNLFNQVVRVNDSQRIMLFLLSTKMLHPDHGSSNRGTMKFWMINIKSEGLPKLVKPFVHMDDSTCT